MDVFRQGEIICSGDVEAGGVGGGRGVELDIVKEHWRCKSWPSGQGARLCILGSEIEISRLLVSLNQFSIRQLIWIVLLLSSLVLHTVPKDKKQKRLITFFFLTKYNKQKFSEHHKIHLVVQSQVEYYESGVIDHPLAHSFWDYTRSYFSCRRYLWPNTFVMFCWKG